MMKLKFILLSLLTFLLYGTIYAQNIIPSPKEYVQKGDATYPIKRVIAKDVDNSSDAYSLISEKGKVFISGNEIWARQTLRQLVDAGGNIPDVEIRDCAAYPMRGFMHDCGRNFQSIEMLKETIDLMSFYKFNVFHWHLTDHPAWRIECKVYPQLNDPQYQRKGRDEGKFYTYSQIRMLIKYAQKRGITVIPEIDMPGHSTYFKDAFGFSMDSEEGKVVLGKCLSEFFEEIPAAICPYFHIGSDEIHIGDPEGFMRWAEDLVRENGRIVIAWDPGLPPSPTTIRQIWNEAAGSNAAATNKSGKYLDSFVGYLNYYDPILFVSRAFLHTACAQLTPDTTNALGGILCLWNDVRVDNKENISLHNGMIAGMMAFAERFWVGGNADIAGKEDVIDPNILPPPESNAGKALAAFEQRIQYHKEHFLDVPVLWLPNASTRWDILVETSDRSTPVVAYGGVIDMDMLCKVNNIDISGEDLPCAYACTDIFSETDTVVNVWFGFEAPARSSRISCGIGQQGKWEGSGHVYVNDIELFPPQRWEEPERYACHFNTWLKPQEEEPYTDEQMYWMRKPLPVQLKKGNNTIFLRAPKIFRGQRWSFSTLFE